MKSLEDQRLERIGVGIGKFLRDVTAASAFGIWQGSAAAGVFAFLVLTMWESSQ